MYARLSVPIATFVRRLIPAVLIAGAATLGSSAVGNPAIACADPAVNWDKQYYQNCKAPKDADFSAGIINDAQYRERIQYCCYKAGGAWKYEIDANGMAVNGDCGDPPPYAVPIPTFDQSLLEDPPPPGVPPTDVPMVP